MSGNIARIFFGGLASLTLAGCASLSGILSSSEPAPVEAVAVEQVDDTAVVPTGGAVAETTALIYEWDTQYSAFLSPPIEVRRQAKNDCVADGYEIAVVETLMLEGNVATAVFICRGDFE